MRASERFQKLIEYVRQVDELEACKKKHISSALEYFKCQLLCDFDRRDSEESISSAWKEFRLLLKGSKILQSFENDKTFWRALETSVGILHLVEPITKATRREQRAEDFFIDVAKEISVSMVDSPQKNLLLFGLWYLQIEARQAGPHRNQDRIQLVYKILHPHLKARGYMSIYDDNYDMKSLVRYFVKGSIY